MLRTGKQERWVGCSELPAGVRLGARGRVRWPRDNEGSPGWGRPRASQVAPEGRGHGSGWKGSPACRQAAGGPLAASLEQGHLGPCVLPRPPKAPNLGSRSGACSRGAAHSPMYPAAPTDGSPVSPEHVAGPPPGATSPQRTASDLAHTHNASPLTGRC